MFQTKVVAKIKTHILSYILFFFFKIVPFMIMWKSNVEPDKPQVTIWRIAGYLRLQTHTQNSNTYCFYTATMVA